MLTFFVLCGAGEEFRWVFREAELFLEDLKSDIKVPAAEGGALAVGACTATGVGSNLALGCVVAEEEAVEAAGFLEI
jgi:hypothetical protein